MLRCTRVTGHVLKNMCEIINQTNGNAENYCVPCRKKNRMHSDIKEKLKRNVRTSRNPVGQSNLL